MTKKVYSDNLGDVIGIRLNQDIESRIRLGAKRSHVSVANYVRVMIERIAEVYGLPELDFVKIPKLKVK